jgi:hypothetical protein
MRELYFCLELTYLCSQVSDCDAILLEGGNPVTDLNVCLEESIGEMSMMPCHLCLNLHSISNLEISDAIANGFYSSSGFFTDDSWVRLDEKG